MIRRLLFLLILGVGLSGCGGPKDFRVEIEGDALGTQRLTVLYTVADGNRVHLEPTAVDGHAEFRGSAPGTTALVEVFGSAGRKLVEFTAIDGDRITVRLTPDGPQIEGLSDQSDQSDRSDRSDNDSVRFEAPRVIVGKDSSEVWEREGVWIFTSAATERRGAVMDSIRANRKRVRDVYVSVEFDTWRELTRRDSATWRQGLLPEGPVDLPALTSTPLLVEVDTAGQILRKQPLKP